MCHIGFFRKPASTFRADALDASPRQSPVILLDSEERPWTGDGFRTSWGKACKSAGISGLTVHGLRGPAVGRLTLAGCSEAEIATITGHALTHVRSILDSHYPNRDPALARNAIRKLGTRTRSPERIPDRAWLLRQAFEEVQEFRRDIWWAH